MSRGLGRIQREVLALIAARRIRDKECDLDTYQLTRLVYDVKPDENDFHRLTDAQVVAVRRALRGLERAGMVARLYRTSQNREVWATAERAAQHEREMGVRRARWGKCSLPGAAAAEENTYNAGAA
ncbi:hypothetical protein [Bradyrhizobium sp. AUGA SZCCT0182]|uniref:hypothetical protein n=1 Tax=Bradyrhizobium sp. AUGA SZCCT0182 TaxID=2807667 RepID=UPI001BA7E39E|nr:hypothetical protein [Bradyrhizobium sp. AUGA SZCCT0182]MBR1237732.1 hypothetical protein [Bradyrhizobium sp. AUGA SZCCT0182]